MSDKPYCEYDCDYQCYTCERNAKALQSPHKENGILARMREAAGGDDEITTPWSGDVCGKQHSYPMTVFTEAGYPVHQTSAEPQYSELKLCQITEAKEIPITGPTTLKKRQIIT